MRIKALLTSILLASTTIAGVASAAPYVRDHRTQETVTYRAPARPIIASNVNYGFQVSASGNYVQPYTYGNDPAPESTPRSSWVKLATQLRLNISSSVTIPVNQHFSVLELQAQWAGLQVNQVRVLLNDGRTITVAANRMLDRTAAPNLRIDLGEQARCGIRSVTVYGSGGGTFGILAA